MIETLTFIHGGLYDGLKRSSKQNTNTLVEKVTSANKIYFSCILIGDQESIYLWKTEKYKSLR